MDTECPVCKDILTEPMEKICGHPVCKKCLMLNQNMAVCPICMNDNDAPWKHLFYLERYCKNIPWECECGYALTHGKRIEHEQVCELKKIQCPMPKCEFSGMPHLIAQHLMKQHVDYKIKTKTEENDIITIAFKEEARVKFIAKIAEDYDMSGDSLLDIGKTFLNSLN